MTESNDTLRPVSDTRPRHIDRRQSWRLIHSSSTSMKVSRDFGIVVRRAALSAKNVDLSTVMTEFNLGRYFDESDNLVSLGPFFGGDAADECMKSLEKLGLAYIEDFFIFEGFVPDWCSFEVF